MEHFTPGAALVGGSLVGIAAVLLLWANGRVAGISGIVAGVLPGAQEPRDWRWAFLLGLVGGAGAWVAWTGAAPAPRAAFGPGVLTLSGLLVGYGTSLAGGCTSGHGVCGLARLAPRSLVGTGVFLVVAVFTALVVRHGLHLV